MLYFASVFEWVTKSSNILDRGAPAKKSFSNFRWSDYMILHELSLPKKAFAGIIYWRSSWLGTSFKTAPQNPIKGTSEVSTSSKNSHTHINKPSRFPLSLPNLSKIQNLPSHTVALIMAPISLSTPVLLDISKPKPCPPNWNRNFLCFLWVSQILILGFRAYIHFLFTFLSIYSNGLYVP